jgi:hypothetical protein
MDTVTVETSELIGPALDWAVAKCEGWEDDRYMRSPYIRKNVHGRVIGIQVPIHREYRWFNPSTDWAQGGPIIEREIESLYEHKPLECWAAKSKQGDLRYGPTPLIAAMRCYVASKLGDTVQIPRELVP